MVGMVDAWVADTQAGHDTFLLAWRRASVEALNRLARDQARQHGWLTGPDLETPDGRLFAVGDLVVTLAPNYRGQLVTSVRTQVVAIDPDAQALTIQTDHGRQVTLLGSELTPDRLAHGYALTVHREQGATSDRTHYLADGGGRELAYVAMSRARHRSTVHVVADNLAHAIERLEDDWSHQQHDTWLTPTTRIGHDPHHEPTAADRAAERGRLRAELEHLHAHAPPDVTHDLAATVARLHTLMHRREHLAAGTGPYQHTEIGRIVRDLHQLERDLTDAQHHLDQARPWERPKWRRLINTYNNHRAHRGQDWDHHGRPETERLDHAIRTTENRITELERDHRFNLQWHHEHPEHAQRIDQLQHALKELDGPGRDTEQRSRDAATVDRDATTADRQGTDDDTGPAIEQGSVVDLDEIQAQLRAINAKLDHLQLRAIEIPAHKPDIGLGL